ncbi:MAG: hypothetical protein KDA93_05720 [Planctomycetaceae bacterium]|nr:hypothetical protein [Planctomycetaceae bacterium]
MKTAAKFALTICAVLIVFGGDTKAVAPRSPLSDAEYRQRAGVSSKDGGVTHAAGVNAGLDQRTGFDAGIFMSGERHQGASSGQKFGDRKDEHWFAGARGGAQAGAFSDATASQSGRVGSVDIRNYAQGEAFVGSEAGVEAGVSNNGVLVGGNAFSGGRVGGRLGTEVGPAGAAGKGEAWSGLGVEAGVNATVRDGKIKLGGELGAALGVGGKLGAEITIETKPIGDAAQNVGRFADNTGRNVGRTAGNVGREIGSKAQDVGRAIGGLFRK